jgi:hypothetical protein
MKACLASLVLVLVAASSAVAQEPAADTPAGTDLPAVPTEVGAGIYVIDIVSVDGASQSFSADIAE